MRPRRTSAPKGKDSCVGILNRSEALAVMHEILDALGESVIIAGVSLDPSGSKIPNFADDYLIKIKCNLDDLSRNRVRPILVKRNLKIDEKEGTAVICSH